MSTFAGQEHRCELNAVARRIARAQQAKELWQQEQAMATHMDNQQRAEEERWSLRLQAREPFLTDF